MKKLEASDLKNLNLLKHYRIIRKWACKNNGLTDAELELIIYFDKAAAHRIEIEKEPYHVIRQENVVVVL